MALPVELERLRAQLQEALRLNRADERQRRLLAEIVALDGAVGNALLRESRLTASTRMTAPDSEYCSCCGKRN